MQTSLSMSTNIPFPTLIQGSIEENRYPDFADYLAGRRGISRESALDLLGTSILDYEPETLALRARRAQLSVVLASELGLSAS